MTGNSVSSTYHEIYTGFRCAPFLQLNPSQISDPSLLCYLALYRAEIGDVEGARSCLASAEENLRLGSRLQQCRCLVLMGLLHWDYLSGLAAAVDHFKKAAKLAVQPEKPLPVTQESYILAPFFLALGAYCMGNQEDFFHWSDVMFKYTFTGLSKVANSCRVLLSLVASVEWGVERTIDDLEFDANTPMPCFRFLLSALLSHLLYTAGKYASFQERDKDLRKAFFAFTQLHDHKNSNRPPSRLPAYLLPAICVWLSTQVRVYADLGRAKSFTPHKADYKEMQQVLPQIRNMVLLDPMAELLEEKLEDFRKVALILSRRCKPPRTISVTPTLSKSRPTLPLAPALVQEPHQASADGDDLINTAHLLVGLRDAQQGSEGPAKKRRRRPPKPAKDVADAESDAADSATEVRASSHYGSKDASSSINPQMPLAPGYGGYGSFNFRSGYASGLIPSFMSGVSNAMPAPNPPFGYMPNMWSGQQLGVNAQCGGFPTSALSHQALQGTGHGHHLLPSVTGNVGNSTLPPSNPNMPGAS